MFKIIRQTSIRKEREQIMLREEMNYLKSIKMIVWNCKLYIDENNIFDVFQVFDRLDNLDSML